MGILSYIYYDFQKWPKKALLQFQIMYVVPEIKVNIKGLRQLSKITKKENILFAELIQQVNSIDYTITMDKYKREYLSDKLDISISRFNNLIRSLVENDLLIRRNRGIYYINKNFFFLIFTKNNLVLDNRLHVDIDEIDANIKFRQEEKTRKKQLEEEARAKKLKEELTLADEAMRQAKRDGAISKHLSFDINEDFTL